MAGIIRTEPCPNCKGLKFEEWRSEGDLTCTQCGLVVEAHLIDEKSEWRTFSDKDSNSSDPNRVGGPSNPLLQGLTTTIGREKGDKGLSYMLNRVHARNNNPDKALVDAFKQIGFLCEQLNCTGTTKDVACEIYKDVVDAKKLRGRSTKALCASCVFMACREVKLPRTFKDITAMLGTDVSKKEIGRCFTELTEYRKTSGACTVVATGATRQAQLPQDFAKSYCYALNQNFNVNKICVEIARRAKPVETGEGHFPWDGRQPQTIAAACIYIGMCIIKIREVFGSASSANGMKQEGGLSSSHANPGQKLPGPMADEIVGKASSVSHMAVSTIRQAYREMVPHLAMLTEGYASKDELARMPTVQDVSSMPPPAAAPQQHQQHQHQHHQHQQGAGM